MADVELVEKLVAENLEAVENELAAQRLSPEAEAYIRRENAKMVSEALTRVFCDEKNG